MPTRIHQEAHFASLDVRYPQLEGGNFVFGPGGQASIVPTQDTSPPYQPGISPQAQLQNSQPYSDVSQQTTISQLESSSLPQLSQSILQASLSPTMTTPLLLQTSLSPTTNTLLASLTMTTVDSFSTPLPSPTDSASSPSETSTGSTLASTSVTASSSSPVTSVAIGVVPTNMSSDSSDESNHGVPFYVGLALGIIVVMACVAALIAWWIRLRAHSKRRREFAATHVPWGKHNDGGLEEARETDSVSGTVSVGVHGDVLHSWEPSGDRDVGEPKRTYSFLHTPISPVKKPTAPFADNFYQPGTPNASHGQVSQLVDSAAYPLPLVNGPYSATRPLPHHLGSVNSSVQGSAHTLGPLQVANLMPGDVSLSRPVTVMGMTDLGNMLEFGTPREVVPGSRPRFWGLEGNGLSVPWAPLRLGSKRSKHTNGGGGGGDNWEHLPPLPMPGETGIKTEFGTEGWTASLRANLVNAFNSVSSNLTVSGGSTRGDNLTPVPQRTSQRRRSRHDAGWAEHVGGQLVGRPLKREITAYSTSSQLSKTWTLEETGDGTGIVHIRGLDNYYGSGDHAWSRPVSLYFSSEDGNDCKTIRSSTTITSQTPLTYMKKPQAALLKPSARNQLYPRSTGNSVSRASSVYSTASAAPSSAYSFDSRPRRIPSRRKTMRSRGGNLKRMGTNRDRQPKQGRVQPENISRISSLSNCSMVSSGSGVSSLGMVCRDLITEEPARILKERPGDKGRGQLAYKKTETRS